MQDDPAALDRARRGDRKSAQGLLPRKGRKGFVPLDDVGAWLADAEIASDRELDEIALFQRAADPPARVVQGRLSYDLCPYAELGAVRAALTRLANHHALVSEMMADTRGLAEDPLTPRSALRAAVDDLVASAARAGLRDRDLRRTTRDMLLQRRKHEQLDLLGGDHLIARLRIDADDAWVTYVPVAALSHLPLLEPLPVRAAVTIHPRQVPHEPRARALKALAIARVHDVQRSVERI